MSNANTPEAVPLYRPLFRHILRSGAPAERRWEQTVAAVLLVVSALPLVALAGAVTDGPRDGGTPVASARR